PNGAYMFRYGATTLATNTWYHVAGVYDAAAQTMVVYLNGTADNGSTVGTVAGSHLDAAMPVYIGRRADTDGQYDFTGILDEVNGARFFGRIS
ncbi:MAG: LamG-like jellyroll fold domain-containing protein, partial [Hypericibacter sp.]